MYGLLLIAIHNFVNVKSMVARTSINTEQITAKLPLGSSITPQDTYTSNNLGILKGNAHYLDRY